MPGACWKGWPSACAGDAWEGAISPVVARTWLACGWYCRQWDGAACQAQSRVGGHVEYRSHRSPGRALRGGEMQLGLGS